MDNLFWDRVAVRTTNECWLWHGTVNAANGYGYWVNGHNPLRAHRVAYELKNGPIPEGQYVLHRCDVRHCVNPAHLFLGTHQENMDDMLAKGRQAKGVDQHLARLTENDVLRIRADTTRTLQNWADELGVSHHTISCVRTGRTWKHVGGHIQKDALYQGERQHLAKLNESAVHTIRASEWTDKDLAAVYGVSPHTIWCVRKRKTWKHVA